MPDKNKKRLIAVFSIFTITLSIIIAMLFSSCSWFDWTRYEMEYSDKFTSEYCYDNYRESDPNLKYLVAAENAIGDFLCESGRIYDFFGIKDVPLEEYLAQSSYAAIWDTDHDVRVVQSKENTKEPLFDYTVVKAELLLLNKPSNIYEYDINNPQFDKNIARWESIRKYDVIQEIDTVSLQKYITEAILNEEYQDGYSEGFDSERLQTEESRSFQVRFYFEEYENLIWSADIYTLSSIEGSDFADEGYYSACYVYEAENSIDGHIRNMSHYRSIFIRLPDDLVSAVESTLNSSNSNN